jgi:hypothetical protein
MSVSAAFSFLMTYELLLTLPGAGAGADAHACYSEQPGNTATLAASRLGMQQCCASTRQAGPKSSLHSSAG